MHNERQSHIASAITVELNRQNVGKLTSEGQFAANGTIDIAALAAAVDGVLHAGLGQEGPTPDQLNSSNDD